MTFPVQPHSAEKVQHDINTMLEAIARFASQMKPPKLPKKSLETDIEQNEVLVIDAEVVPEFEALPYDDPPLLEGNPAAPQLVPEVRLQLDSLHMAVPLPQLRQSLEQLSPDQLATLAGAIAPPALPADHETKIGAEVIDIEVDGTQCFHQEQGHVTVNHFILPEAAQSNKEAEHSRDTVITTEIGEAQPELPSTELRPVSEVESLTGQELGDLSTLHNEVLHQAPSIRVERDQFGTIKGGTAIRSVVEPTEDKVEADLEYRSEHSLTPEAKAIVTQLHDYFERSGEGELTGKRDYDIQADGDRIVFIPKGNPAEVVIIQGDQAISSSSERIEHLMVRFTAAYESIRTTEQSSDYPEGGTASQRDIELTR